MLAYLRKERLPKWQLINLMMKKIGPLKVVYKYGQNAYEVELPPTLGISPIFNVCDLYPYKAESPINQKDMPSSVHEDWVKDFPPSQPVELESILDTKIVKKTRKGVYKNYLVKWKGLPDSDAMWMSKADILQHGVEISDLITQGT